MKRRKHQATESLCKEIETSHANNNFSQENWQNITRYLREGADSNCKIGEFQRTPLFFAIQYKCNAVVEDLLKKYGADFNQKDQNNYTPLALAIKLQNLEIIKTLCNAGASLSDLDKHDNTAFHLVLNTPTPPEYIRACMTHFSSYEEEDANQADKMLKETALELFLTFKNYQLPTELILCVIANLPPNYFYYAEKGLCKKLLESGYDHPYISAQVNSNKTYLEGILSLKNNKGLTACERWLLSGYLQFDLPLSIQCGHRRKTELLLSGGTLDDDYRSFNENFPSNHENLLCKMYIHYKAAFKKARKESTTLFQ